MNLLFLTFLAPLIGYLLLSFSRGKISENAAATIGVGSIGISALTTALVAFQFSGNPQPFTQVLWTWMQVGDFAPRLALYLDGLSVTMLGVITGVGFFIHLFASWYMRGEEGYTRFFSYMNLFVASMVLLVLGDNLVFLYFGWEGVGLCSYLLIGFYYRTVANGNAAIKAFIVTRIGDVFMAIGMFILLMQVGTLNIQELMIKAPQVFTSGDPLITAATLLLLGGAVGKSAQLPLQTWLADAMAGPTPVSALIHAATMVTAGVYLIARTHGLFELAPDVLDLVGNVGAVTLLIAGLCALVQTDIKRVLAYSTMSQIGYMFLALGAGAFSAAIFHLMTHAFFKALLFLSSGAVIIACHHEQNIFKMGGLRKSIPLVYWCFVVGGLALSALPFVTAGFYSKDEILWSAFAANKPFLFYAGLAGALLTSIYTFRLIFTVFHGEEKIHAHAGHGLSHHIPLVVLMVLSTFVGALIHPPLADVLPASPGAAGGEDKHFVEIVSSIVGISGIAIAAVLFLGKRSFVTALAQSSIGQFVSRWWLNAFGFDALYHQLFVRPFLRIARPDRRDGFDSTINVLPWLVRGLNALIVKVQTGNLRWYAASMAIGAALVLGAVVIT
jgi:NADH-quinone oxidoreductase subunit L